VNEGAVEWPPSPWRLLRALVATWKQRCAQLAEADVAPLLRALAHPPRYLLPEFAVAHTRHYFPESDDKRVKTFDPFVVVGRGCEAFVQWDQDLDDRGREVFEELLGALPYLGRADALVEARLIGSDGTSSVAMDSPGWLEPVGSSTGAPDTMRLLCPALPLDVATLVVRPQVARKQRRQIPVGSRWVDYPRPRASDAVLGARPAARHAINAVRFALTADTVSDRGSLSTPDAAVGLGDRLRACCMSKYGAANDQRASSTLSGKRADGSRLDGRHEHAHYLSFRSSDMGPDRRFLDSMVVWAPSGFDAAELHAVAQRHELRAPEHVKGVNGRRLAVEAVGSIGQVAPELVGPSRVWRSSTPYAPSRQGKRTIEELVREDITRELDYRGLPRPTGVRLIEGNWLAFRRHRVSERLEDARRAFGVEIEFAEPVIGPLALGQLSHFGLGLFRPLHR
jgi:CRISPR-associated protein Csb2